MTPELEKILEKAKETNRLNLDEITLTDEVCEEITKWTHLSEIKTIFLSDCKLKSIPNFIFQIKNLEDLYLGGNLLQFLPSEFFQLKSLLELDISDNQITNIPMEISQLTKLYWFFMHNNPIDYLQFGYMFNGVGCFDFFRDIVQYEENFSFKENSEFFIHFQNGENYGFIRIFPFMQEDFSDSDFRTNHSDEFNITYIFKIFGKKETQLKVLNTFRRYIEKSVRKNDIQYLSDGGKLKHKNTCTRFFVFRVNQEDVSIDFDKLLQYKQLGKSIYEVNKSGINAKIPVEDLLIYIGAENESIESQWKGSAAITSIAIENFKIFRTIACENLSPQINILLGRNGLGKTSFLQALTLALLPPNNVDKSNQFENYIHLSAKKSEITVHWGEESKKVYVFKNEVSHKEYVDFPQKLILAYGVNLNTHPSLSHTDIVEQLVQGNALPYSTKSIFNDYSTDFYDPLIILERLYLEKRGRKNKTLDSIIHLIKDTLNNYLDLFYEPEKISLVGELATYYFQDLNQTRLKTHHLSEGYKDFILQISDILVRILASRNSLNLGENLKIVELFQRVKGVVMIDEFDRHLHPQLQRKLLHQLQADFPSIQFILSTHNIFSLQSAEGFTALIVHTENQELKITSKEIKKGLSIESIYNRYFEGNDAFFGYETELLFDKFYQLLRKQKVEILSKSEAKTFKDIVNELLTYGDETKGIVSREIRQLERQIGKTIKL